MDSLAFAYRKLIQFAFVSHTNRKLRFSSGKSGASHVRLEEGYCGFNVMSKARLELYVSERVAKFKRFEYIKEFDLTFNVISGLVLLI
jgi:hypothetical protein